jgi:DNA-binding transcriptional LysR family regulator
VCDTLNFTRAAEKCNVTQPALSRAVQQLEAEVGGLLFRREGKLTHMTDLGLLMKPRLQQIFDETEQVKSEAKRFLTLQDAQMKLGVMCTIGPMRFTSFLAAFKQSNPGVEISVIEGVPANLIARMEAGEIDVAIMAHPDGFPERFDVRSLYRERFTVAFPAGHRFAGFAAVPIRELKGEQYLRRINCEYRDHLANLCEQSGFAVNLAHASEREDWILNMVTAGFGVCFLPEFSAISPGIMTRPIVEPEIWRDVSVVTVSGRRFSPAVTAFVRSVKAYEWPQQRALGTVRAA